MIIIPVGIVFFILFFNLHCTDVYHSVPRQNRVTAIFKVKRVKYFITIIKTNKNIHYKQKENFSLICEWQIFKMPPRRYAFQTKLWHEINMYISYTVLLFYSFSQRQTSVVYLTQHTYLSILRTNINSVNSVTIPMD